MIKPNRLARDFQAAPVYRWLGLLPTQAGLKPFTGTEGLHGAKRHTITARYTRPSVAGARFLSDALVAAYPQAREKRLMEMLRPQQLDDALWRQVYAVMVQGGPIWLWDLVRNLAVLTGSDRAAAVDRATMLYQRWDTKARRDD